MKYLIIAVLFFSCRKSDFKPTEKVYTSCKDWEGIWWSIDFKDSLVIKLDRQIKDTVCYTGNIQALKPYLKHICPYVWTDDNLIINGHEFRLQH